MLPFLHPTPFLSNMKWNKVLYFCLLFRVRFPCELVSIHHLGLNIAQYQMNRFHANHIYELLWTENTGWLLLWPKQRVFCCCFLFSLFLRKGSDYLFTLCMSGPFYLFICYLLIFTSTPLPAKFQRKETQIIVFFFKILV